MYIITHFWFPSSPQRRNKQDAYQNHYSQVWKAVTFVCVTFVSLPCPTYWPILPGQVKYVPPATARPVRRRDWWNTFSEKVMVSDRVFTSFCVEKRGRWPLINTIFTQWTEKDRADSISENLPFNLAHATVNNRKNQFSLAKIKKILLVYIIITHHFCIKSLAILSSLKKVMFVWCFLTKKLTQTFPSNHVVSGQNHLPHLVRFRRQVEQFQPQCGMHTVTPSSTPHPPTSSSSLKRFSHRADS